MRNYWVYIMTNMNNTVIYTGVTNDLIRRVFQHKNKKGSAFTKKYNINKLVYFETFNKIMDAIAAEKQIKAGSRAKKIQLIKSKNPEWKDLYNIAMD
ncbi:MAG: excinuclease ABC subunit C [Planctomycetes bacterium GWF2_41_51]|nr:MAG: excinuclease ABC subunit C [Planctomycetes bacterium GWF2_41_51]HBG25703.1 excinuclease ABC subunit C [Phycisphaerales bacterium]